MLTAIDIQDTMPSTRPKRISRLASSGCRLCHKGAKMVLFVTGKCDRTCWYCPLSKERKGQGVMFANERPVTSRNDILEEAVAMSALGTGITGGEPLLVPERVAGFSRLLKEKFGPDHHIHLYTGLAPEERHLRMLQGLVDEIRMHPPHEDWEMIASSEFAAAAKRARELGFAVGIEVPALPGLEAFVPLLPVLDFLNINELEWGETNAPGMRERGLELEDSLHNAIRGAKEWASTLLREEKVHWCSSRFKDSVQLRERLKRIARNTARPFEEITPDGTVVYGVIETGEDAPVIPALEEGNEFERLPERIELAWQLLAGPAGKIPGKKYIIERYPNGGIIVEVTPL